MPILNLLSDADFLGRSFQTERVGLFKRQRGEQLKAAFYLLGHLPESPSLFPGRTFHGGRIRRTPMRDDRLVRPGRAALFRIVTEGNDEIELRIRELFPRFASASDASVLKS